MVHQVELWGVSTLVCPGLRICEQTCVASPQKVLSHNIPKLRYFKRQSLH